MLVNILLHHLLKILRNSYSVFKKQNDIYMMDVIEYAKIYKHINLVRNNMIGECNTYECCLRR